VFLWRRRRRMRRRGGGFGYIGLRSSSSMIFGTKK